MKYLFPLGLLIAGLTIGYLVGVNSIDDISDNQITTTDSVTTKLVYDTIVTKQIIEIPVEVEKNEKLDTLLLDSVNVNQVILDTLTELFQEKPKDSLIDEAIKINQDKRIASITVAIIYIDDIVDKDSLIKNNLDINDIKNQSMVVEFWESPINYRGYKLSKSKLVIYGLSPQFDYKIYRKHNLYFLNFQSIFYEMIETNQFLPYLLIEQSEVLND